MIYGAAPASFVWTCVLLGTAVFFLVLARRLSGRGYEYLGLAMGALSVASAGDAILAQSGPGLVSLLGSRVGLFVGLFAIAFHLHFVYRYCALPGSEKVIWASYVLVGAAGLANAMGTVTQLNQLAELSFPGQYLSPSDHYSYVALFLIGAHFVLSASLLFRGYRAGRKVTFVLAAFLMMAPASFADLTAQAFLGMKWYVTEVGAWSYCLVILATLLSEMQRAEGLLKETTSNLASRTAELEVSYAEIDFMYHELSQKQQLAAVGELAAAIAHEVRNPLAIIMNAVSGMRRVTITPTDRETLLSIVNEESERLNQLVTELLRFARPVAASKGPASLLDICKLAAKDPPDGYTLEVSTPDEETLEPVLVDPGLFRLALDNLLANSVQAMPEGGVIGLSVRRSSFADGTPAAAVDIVDTGCGMAKKELEAAKKPFFTTKPRGTGLGIPIADRIVVAHGGEMEIKSELKKGTTVTIYVPFEHEAQRVSVYPGTKHPSTRRRLRSIPPGETIIMDDRHPEDKSS